MVVREDGHPVCLLEDVRTGGEKRPAANARLIAAAPDLLDALRQFHRAAKSWHDFHHGTNIQCDWLCECIEPAAAAIEKATESKEGG